MLRNFLFFFLCLGSSAASLAAPLPQDGAEKHLGNVTCGNAFCHEARQPWKVSAVPQNEYTAWASKDAHRKAYEALSGDLGKKIAGKLGLKNPANQEKQCLDCHANNVPVAARTRTFALQDGVSCEACHGGAYRWLEVHVSGAGMHADNIAAGMYPTDDPVSRARLCMSCHLGNEKKFVNHRLIAAGHPRLVFELDTYTAAEPAHYVVNDAYKQRKKVAGAIQTWAIGQAMSVQLMMDGILNPERFSHSIYPELSFFDCNTCHHRMSEKRWTARTDTGLGPGVPKLNTASLVMLQIITGKTQPAVSGRLKQEVLALHKATLDGNAPTMEAAMALRASASQLVDDFAKYDFGPQDLVAMMTGIVNKSDDPEYLDHVAAEQATLALSTIVAGLHATGGANDAEFKQLKLAMEPVYKAVDKDELYRPQLFRSALRQFGTAARMLEK